MPVEESRGDAPDARDLPAAPDAPDAPDAPWWKTAVVYQVYIRSFADSDGDGVGDVRGLRDRLPYLAALGVDALWINPWYPSPLADAGYDVADYRDIDPAYGTLADAEALVADAHERGLRVILDIVPNHTSSEHAWFRAAIAGDDAARRRYIFRAGRGAGGSEPPNDWRSAFGGSAWTRSPDGRVDSDGRAEWYLHLFDPGQPDLDWSNDEVREEFEDILRFWFDRGVDGFRIDVAHGLVKAPDLPDASQDMWAEIPVGHPAWDQDGVHEIYRGWRKVADSYDDPRVFVAEAWVADSERLARYLRPDELHTAFQFDFLRAPFRADVIRAVVDDALATSGAVGAASTWVLGNHDVVRQVTRFARPQPDALIDMGHEKSRWRTEPADVALGTRRARAAALVVLALPGVAYLYQGEELGLPEYEDLPDDARQDPSFAGSLGADPGRDGARVPLPWSGDAPPYGFSPDDAAPTWLPQPSDWAELTAEHESDDPASTLWMYADALRLRRDRLRTLDELAWRPSPPQTLAFARAGVECWLNTGDEPVPLPEGRVLVASGPGVEAGVLPADTAVWLEVA